MYFSPLPHLCQWYIGIDCAVYCHRSGRLPGAACVSLRHFKTNIRWLLALFFACGENLCVFKDPSLTLFLHTQRGFQQEMKVSKCELVLFFSFTEMKLLFVYHIPCLQGQEPRHATAQWIFFGEGKKKNSQNKACRGSGKVTQDVNT